MLQENRFKREILIVLAVKLILIIILKAVFFSTPVAPHLRSADLDHLFFGSSNRALAQQHHSSKETNE